LPDKENVGRNFAAPFVRLDLILISVVVVHEAHIYWPPGARSCNHTFVAMVE
jgi:hypothetical protein